jgi:branched-chain amino acid transport system ATP-binding protein
VSSRWEMASATQLELELRGVSGGYGRGPDVVKDIDLQVPRGAIVSILGANGAGKTTLLRLVAGFCRTSAGTVQLVSKSLSGLSPARRVRLGLTMIPQGHQLFGGLSVRENLMLGAYVRRREMDVARQLEDVYRIFPILGERQSQLAESLSGGERAMLSVGRGMMTRAPLLLLDEPSLGLAPHRRADMFNTLAEQCRSGSLTILLAEQDVTNALRVSSFVYVLQSGRIVTQGRPADISGEALRLAYLGLAGGPEAVRASG